MKETNGADAAGGAYNASPDPLAGGEGLHGCSLPRTSSSLSAFQASPVPAPKFSNPLQSKIIYGSDNSHDNIQLFLSHI